MSNKMKFAMIILVFILMIIGSTIWSIRQDRIRAQEIMEQNREFDSLLNARIMECNERTSKYDSLLQAQMADPVFVETVK